VSSEEAPETHAHEACSTWTTSRWWRSPLPSGIDPTDEISATDRSSLFWPTAAFDHASTAVTLDVYSDRFDDDLDAVAAALDRAALRSSVGRMWAATPSGRDDTVQRNEETPG